MTLLRLKWDIKQTNSFPGKTSCSIIANKDGECEVEASDVCRGQLQQNTDEGKGVKMKKKKRFSREPNQIDSWRNPGTTENLPWGERPTWLLRTGPGGTFQINVEELELSLNFPQTDRLSIEKHNRTVWPAGGSIMVWSSFLWLMKHESCSPKMKEPMTRTQQQIPDWMDEQNSVDSS